jgi:hypothetical protein
MASKKKYYSLDDIGFIGTQQKEKKSTATKEEYRLTGAALRPCNSNTPVITHSKMKTAKAL